MCGEMDYWKDYTRDKGRGKAALGAKSDQFPLRERRLFDINNASETSASKNFKNLELEAYMAISKLYLPPEVYEEWFGTNGRLVNWNSGDVAKTSNSMPPARALDGISQGCKQTSNIKLPMHLSSTPMQPTPKKGVSFSDIPPPQVSVRPKSSQVGGIRGSTPILKKASPLPFGVVLLGDSTLSHENVTSIVRNNALVMGPDSKHDMPPIRVLNLCGQDYPIKIEQLLYHEHTIMQWASFEPRVTVLQIGTCDLVTGALGQYPTQRTFWRDIRRFCLHVQEMARTSMNVVSGVSFTKLMEEHQFIVLPPLDFLEYKPKPGLIDCSDYVDIRGSANKGLLMNRATLYNEARAVVCFTQVKSAGYKLNNINQVRYNNKIAHCIARLLCRKCRLADKISHGEHADMMRKGCAHPGRSPPIRTD